MIHKRRLSAALSALTVALLGSTAALAQVSGAQATENQPATESPAAASDIIVTANKREQRLQDVGATISVLGSETLNRLRVSSLADIAQAVPGLTYTQTQVGSPVYTLRGVGFYDASVQAYPDVATYIDQFSLPFPDTSRLTAFDLERIEVLKGPQGTLFGNNATGGALNFIAAKPKDTFGAGATLGYGRFNTIEAGGYVTGPLSETLSARLAIKAVRGDDWQRSTTRKDTLGKTNTTTARLLLDWKPTERLTVSLNANGWIDKSDPIAPQFYKSDPQIPAGSSGLGGTIPANAPVLTYSKVPTDARGADWAPNYRPARDDRFGQLAGRFDYRVTDDVTLTSMSSYLKLDMFSPVINYDGTDTAGYMIGRRKATVSTFAQEVRLANGTSSPLHWIIGANYDRSNTLDTADILALKSTSSYANGVCCGRYTSNVELENYAAFGNLEYRISPELTLKAGVRQTKAKASTISSNTEQVEYGLQGMPFTITQFFNIVWASIPIYPNFKPLKSGDNYTIDNRLNANGKPLNPATFGTVGPSEGYRGTLDQNSTSWTVGLDYKVADDVLLYATVAKGFKAGGFPTLSAATWSQFEPVVQEQLLDFEGGFKASLADRRVTLNGAAFYYDYRDKQTRAKVVDSIFGLIDALVNVPKSTIYGAELEFGARPIPGLTIDASAVFLKAKIDQYNGVISSKTDPATGLLAPVTGNYAGVELPFTPKFQFNGSIAYDMPVSDNTMVSVGMNVSAQTQSYSILALSALDKVDYKIAGRAIFGGNITLHDKDDRYRVSLWGKNLFNKYYIDNSLLGYDTRIRYAGRPVEYGVTVTAKW